MRVIAPARLHLGFLDLNGSLGRLFGSIGLAIDTPRTELVLKRARAFKGEGPDSTRAVSTLRRFAEVFSLDTAYDVKVSSAIPAHAGLGSGTQLALAAGAALMELEGLAYSPAQLGEIVDRGARSAIGMAAFERAASSSTAAAVPSTAPPRSWCEQIFRKPGVPCSSSTRTLPASTARMKPTPSPPSPRCLTLRQPSFAAWF